MMFSDKDLELKKTQNLTKELQSIISKRSENHKKQNTELQKAKTERGRMQNELESTKLETRELKTQITELEKEK